MVYSKFKPASLQSRKTYKISLENIHMIWEREKIIAPNLGKGAFNYYSDDQKEGV